MPLVVIRAGMVDSRSRHYLSMRAFLTKVNENLSVNFLQVNAPVDDQKIKLLILNYFTKNDLAKDKDKLETWLILEPPADRPK